MGTVTNPSGGSHLPELMLVATRREFVIMVMWVVALEYSRMGRFHTV